MEGGLINPLALIRTGAAKGVTSPSFGWAFKRALKGTSKISRFLRLREALGNELSRRSSSLDLSLINILIADRA
jgi:hypothetical protein